jgi:exopolysaccharide biosynthesis polyprenyl glycosylphosphotransferase
MDSNGVLRQHWLHVSVHYGIDALIFGLAFLLGTYLRLPSEVVEKLANYWPGILFGALLFASAIYIFGFYSPQSSHEGIFKRSFVIGICLVATFAVMFGAFYAKKSRGIGRGVMARSLPVVFFSVCLHHALLLRSLRNYRERVAFIVTCPFDELEARLFEGLGRMRFELAGVVNYRNYSPGGHLRVLGTVNQLSDVVDRERIDRILCTNKSINDPSLCKQFCELRYSGITVMPLISLFEEIHQVVPLELITTEWLFNASGLPHLLYIKKIKRGFDIASSLFGLVFLGPFMLLGMALTKMTSKGPIFYRQLRLGRFGRAFEVIKLRTMRVDAEKDGAVWAATNDSRVTPVGNFLRKFRIDEIPQLFNVLRGEMSFVGPRPERPEFIDQLSDQIPYFRERLMVQPGITGWAQVSYPYGASVEDARRKLEFDLYYMKHMSLFLDLFIILDTVRIILRGGLGEAHKHSLPRYGDVVKEYARPKDPDEPDDKDVVRVSRAASAPVR